MYISLNGLDWQREVRGTRPRTDEISRHAEIESKGCSDNHANYMTPHEVEGKKNRTDFDVEVHANKIVGEAKGSTSFV